VWLHPCGTSDQESSLHGPKRGRPAKQDIQGARYAQRDNISRYQYAIRGVY